MSQILKSAFALVAVAVSTLAFAASAQAGPATLPPLSSYFDAAPQIQYAAPRYGASYAHHTTTRGHTPYVDSAFAQTHTVHAPPAQVGFHGATPPLGAGESLQATSCPVAVHNPEGGQVLGCYNVVKPVPKPVIRPVTHTTYYQVVRPIIYVRYPVPVPVCGVPVCRPRPVIQPCAMPCVLRPVIHRPVVKRCGPVCVTGPYHHGGSRYGY